MNLPISSIRGNLKKFPILSRVWGESFGLEVFAFVQSNTPFAVTNITIDKERNEFTTLLFSLV